MVSPIVAQLHNKYVVQQGREVPGKLRRDLSPAQKKELENLQSEWQSGGVSQAMSIQAGIETRKGKWIYTDPYGQKYYEKDGKVVTYTGDEGKYEITSMQELREVSTALSKGQEPTQKTISQQMAEAPSEAPSEAPPLTITPYVSQYPWRRAPISRAMEEITIAEEKLYQRERPGYVREMKGFVYGAAGLGVGFVRAIAHPIKTVKEFGYMVRHPLETGEVIGMRLQEKPGAFTAEVAGTVLLWKAPKIIPKAKIMIGKKISTKYVPKAKVGIEYGKWTEIVPTQKQLLLAGKEITVTQVSPKAWFKPFRKIAKVKPAKLAEMRYPRRVAGEVYTYWQPPIPTGKPKALLGFGGIEPTAETGLIYALRHPKKVKWTLLGKPAAEIKIVRGKVYPLPKKIMKMKPSIKAERMAAEYIMKRPGKFFIPAEVKRVTRPIERAGFQEYQIALAPPTKLVKPKKIWTEIYGQKVKVIRAELEKAPMKPTIPVARKIALERYGKAPLKIKPTKPYYAPAKYYPISKVLRVGIIPSYKPTKYYKKPKYVKPSIYYPTKYVKPSIYYPTKYVKPSIYYPTKYVKPVTYKPTHYIPGKYVKPSIYYPTKYAEPSIYYPTKPVKKPPIIPPPIVSLIEMPGKRRKPKKKKGIKPIRKTRYVPTVAARTYEITAPKIPKAYVVGAGGLGGRPIIKTKKKVKKKKRK